MIVIENSNNEEKKEDEEKEDGDTYQENSEACEMIAPTMHHACNGSVVCFTSFVWPFLEGILPINTSRCYVGGVVYFN